MIYFVIAVAIIVVGAVVWYYEEKLDDKDKIIEGMQKDIDDICELNGMPLMGNFEDGDELPSEERFNEMLDEILLQTNITREL